MSRSGTPSPRGPLSGLRALPLALLLLVIWVPTAAYIRMATSTTDATGVRWDLDEALLSLPNVDGAEVVYQVNPLGSDNVGDGSELVAVDSAFRHWESIQSSRIAFKRGSDSSLQEASDDGINLIYWAEGSKTPVLGSKNFDVVGFVGLTVIVNDTTGPTAGLMRNADIILNGNELTWTTDPATDANSFDVETILTHEAGHVLGLEHSPVLGSTMYGRLDPGVITPISFAADDVSGASSIYPMDPNIFTAEQRGVVQNGLGGRVLGAIVNTFDADGVLASGTITDPNGRYSSAALAPGPHFTYVEPLDDPGASVTTLFDETDLGGVWDSTVINNFISTADANINLPSGGTAVKNFLVGTTGHTIHISAIGQRAIAPGSVVFDTRATQVFTGDVNVFIGVSGPGVDDLQIFEILGTGITVNGVAASTSHNGEPAVVYDISVDPNAVPGARSIRIQNQGQRVYATGAVEVLDSPVITAGVVELPGAIPSEVDPGIGGNDGLDLILEGNGVRISWTADPQATEYDVYRGDLLGFFNTKIYTHATLPSPNGTCGVFETTYLFKGDGTDVNAYYYMVRARNRLGTGLLGTDSLGAPRPDGTPACP